MAVDGSLNFDTKVDAKGLNKGLSGITSSLGKIAKMATAAFGVAGLISFSKQAINTASDMQEVQNVVDTAFGDMSYKMEAFADTAIDTYGISKLTAKQMGSTFMAMGKGMDLASDTASDMALNLTGRAADIASFYNKTSEEANTLMKSIYTGETEALKSIGVVMTEASLEAYALTQGLTKSVSAMSQAEKVQLRYGYVMQQTALAQGDFAKTSDGWANQTRILSEKWKEFGANVGSVLIDVLLPCVRALNNAMSSLIKISAQAAAAVKSVLGVTADTADNTKAVASNAETAAKEYTGMASSAYEAAKSADKQLAGFDKMTKLSDGSGAGGASGAGAVAPSITTAPTVQAETETEKQINGLTKTFGKLKAWVDNNFSSIFKDFWGDFTKESLTLVKTLKKVFADIKKLGKPLVDYLKGDFTIGLQAMLKNVSNIITGLFDSFNKVFADIWNIAVYPIVKKLVTDIMPMFAQISTQIHNTLSVLFDNIKKILDKIWAEAVAPALAFVVQIWNDCWDSVKADWDKWGQPIFDSLREALNKSGEMIMVLWDEFLKPVLDSIMSACTDLWDNHLKPLLDNLLDFIGELVNGALEIYNNFIQPVVKWFVEVLGPPIAGVVGNIIDRVKAIVGTVVDVVSGIITSIKGIVQFITGVFTGDWGKAWDGIKNIFKGIWDGFVTIVKTPINLIIGLINGMISVVAEGVNFVIRALNKLSFDIPDWVPGIGGKHFGFDIAEIVPPQIPKLATGTVVPASYGEFAAILGDNKRETEVVSPLSTIKQALKEAMQEAGDTAEKIITILLQLDGNIIYKSVVDANRRNTSSTGTNALIY